MGIPDDNLDHKVTAIIKTFERAEKVRNLHASLRQYYPTLPVVIVDDSQTPMTDVWDPHTRYIHADYDIGLSQGRNLAVSYVDTPFTLLLDDDFLFTPETKIETFLQILETTDFQIVAGQVLDFGRKNRVFKGMLEVHDTVLYLNNYHKGPRHQGHVCYDFVLNFFLARTQTLRDNPWDPELKIREHEDFFWRLKQKNILVTSTQHVSIGHYPTSDTVQKDDLYFQKRVERFHHYHHLACQKIGVTDFVPLGAMYYHLWFRHMIIWLKFQGLQHHSGSLFWKMIHSAFCVWRWIMIRIKKGTL
ncbi:MAG: glycosyltransferase family 2 protein [Alphaproteobacteria bacterium]|nr:glycosyltransferase family 2 protein [Alphaproteobacteria bacterium]